MVATDVQTYTQRFEAAEADALGKLLEDLQPIARGDPARLRAVELAQRADWFATAEADDRERDLRLRAAAARERSRLEHPGRGRPPKPPEQQELDDFRAERADASDDAQQALDTYIGQIGRLNEAAPDLDRIEQLSDEHWGKVEATLKALDKASALYTEAGALADEGRAIMRRFAGLVCFQGDPFMDLQQPPRFLADLLKRLRMRFDVEADRLGADPREEIAEMKARQAAGQYQRDLAAAAKSYRTSTEGKTAWAQYKAALRELEAAQAADPRADVGGYRDCAQRLLDRFHDAACGHASMVPDKELYPRLG